MRRLVACLLLATISLAGCMSAPRTVASPRTYIPVKRPARIWLTDAEGASMEVNRPRLFPGDTLFGRTRLGDEIWIALSDVDRIQARELDKNKTLLVAGGFALGAGIFFALAASTGKGDDRDVLDRPEMNFTLFRSR